MSAMMTPRSEFHLAVIKAARFTVIIAALIALFLIALLLTSLAHPFAHIGDQRSGPPGLSEVPPRSDAEPGVPRPDQGEAAGLPLQTRKGEVGARAK
jgi:hypothetical protein